MTLVSSFFATESATFSQLLAGAMASPLAYSSAAAENYFVKEDDVVNRNSGFKQSRPMNLIVARSPVFTIPPGLSPSGFLNSPGFFSPQVIDLIDQFLKRDFVFLDCFGKVRFDFFRFFGVVEMGNWSLKSVKFVFVFV